MLSSVPDHHHLKVFFNLPCSTDFSDGLLAPVVLSPSLSAPATNGDGGYYVFNPSTGAALALPDSKVPLKSSFELPTKPYKPCPWPPAAGRRST
ncbi:hypothetical protein GUJ93_ZPchr0012g19861 [Zizania palustris]|uniref:Uncharacterized protein n=1 Tax=Zizania palustris TaxID=103762 RepID=A0A8J5WNN7_ZIZPA|nr:hypothetical protein GUJ93_ZPchr0012g19861 [Zizania palustris]